MTVEEDGSICYYLSRRKRVSAKGLKVSKEAKWILVVLLFADKNKTLKTII